jgi:hypothetical protein
LQFLVDRREAETYDPWANPVINFPRMTASINFIELENRVIAATYRNLMIRAKVVVVDSSSGESLADPVTTISSPAPNGSLRIRLPDSVKSGTFCLRALNAHGQQMAQSGEFQIG